MPEALVRYFEEKPHVVAALRQTFEERIPFNHALGLKVVDMNPAKPRMRFDMRPDMVGNFARGILHGGVIASVLDVTSGLAAMLGLIAKHVEQGEPLEAQLGRFSRIGTIDLRVDYLRPGSGKWFEASAEVIRSGSRVAVVRSDLHNDSGEQVATAMAAFTVG